MPLMSVVMLHPFLTCFPYLQGVEPVLRTYNTLIIACNMCNQPREAMAVHRRMLSEGYTPNATTYNALISAYGKAGQLDKVMEVRAIIQSCVVCRSASPGNAHSMGNARVAGIDVWHHAWMT